MKLFMKEHSNGDVYQFYSRTLDWGGKRIGMLLIDHAGNQSRLHEYGELPSLPIWEAINKFWFVFDQTQPYQRKSLEQFMVGDCLYLQDSWYSEKYRIFWIEE